MQSLVASPFQQFLNYTLLGLDPDDDYEDPNWEGAMRLRIRCKM